MASRNNAKKPVAKAAPKRAAAKPRGKAAVKPAPAPVAAVKKNSKPEKPIKVVGAAPGNGLTVAGAKKVNVRVLIQEAPALDMAYVSNKKTVDVWAINTCPRGGRILIDLGEDQVLTIPDTFAPINLMSMVPKEAVLRSSSFRDAIRDRPGFGRMLKIIDSKLALELLKRPAVIAELQRLDDKVRERLDARSGRNRKPRAELEAEVARAQPRVVETLSRRERGNIDSKALWRELDAMKLTTEDLRYISLNAKSEEDKKKARNRMQKAA